MPRHFQTLLTSNICILFFPGPFPSLFLSSLCSGTNRDYWVNMRTQVSQWTRPYLRKAFRAQDLEIETFVAVLIRNDVLAKRCAFVR